MRTKYNAKYTLTFSIDNDPVRLKKIAYIATLLYA